MKKQMFTYVELIGIAAVVAVMAALLVPAVSRAVESNHAAQCKDNLNKSMAGQLSYFNESDGRFICWETQGKKFSRWSEVLFTKGYVPRSAIACPQIPKHARSFEGFGIRRPDDFDYNGTIREVKDGKNMLNMKNLSSAADMIVLADTIRKSNAGQWIQHGSFNTIRRNDNNGYADARHDGKINVAFADGHVEALAPRDFLKRVNDSAMMEEGQNVTRYVNLNTTDEFLSGK